MEKLVEQQLLAATEIIEQQLDAEIQQLEKLHTDDDFEELRLKRLEAMKRGEKQKQEWIAAGHGKYEEVGDEGEFFAASKKSKNFVCHFYRTSTEVCKIVDKHLSLIASKHIETRFVKINAERAMFLVKRLKIRMIPTICLIQNAKTVDYIVGLDDVGGREDFPTEMLEWRIAQARVIDYSGDLLNPPTGGGGTKGGANKLLASAIGGSKKTIRGRNDSDDDDD